MPPHRKILAFFAAFLFSISGCNTSPDSVVAGKAYIETEEGELVLADGTRGTDSTPPSVPSPPVGSDEEWLTQFDLLERSGRSIQSEELKGQPYVVSFFFSLCPTICIKQNEKLQLLQQKFEHQPVRFLSISCDPEVDRPAVLSEYANKFDADQEQWLFLTGELTYIRRVGSEIFSLPVDRRFHTEKFVLVGADGKIFGTYNWTDAEQWQALQSDIESMIEAGGRLPIPEAKPVKNVYQEPE